MTTKSKTTTTTTTTHQEKHKMSEIDENISKLFDIKKRLGKGAYGIVWKALDRRTNETLAVKKIFDAFRDETDAQRTFREIVFLNAFRSHPNIISLHNVYKAINNLDIYLIFEYMDSDLHNIIKKGSILKDIHKRYVIYQLINAIKFIHSGNVIHRDLKPSNVLIDTKCRCKLADFGLARSVSNIHMRDTNELEPQEPLLTDYVATRWYRAPEILVASKRYTKGIDMWSLGCILGEMLRGKPLFQGSSTINQIEKIVNTLPEVTEHDIAAVGAGFGSVLLSKNISREPKLTLDEQLNDAPLDALALVKSLLVLDPLARLTAKEALCHPYVQKFRNTITEADLNVDVLPPFRDDVRLTVPEYRSKLYEFVQAPQEKQRKSTIHSISSKHTHREKIDTIRKSNKIKGTSSSNEYIMKEKTFCRLDGDVQQITYPNNVILGKTLRKTNSSPGHKHRTESRHIKSSSKYVASEVKLIEQRESKMNYIEPRGKSSTKFSESDDSSKKYALDKRHSIDLGYGSRVEISKQPPTPHKVSKKVDNISGRLHKSSSNILRNESSNSQVSMNVHHAHIYLHGNHQQQHGPPVQVQPHRIGNGNGRHADAGQNEIKFKQSAKISGVNVRSSKSETLPIHKQLAPVCYEKRLQKLEEEIERYKKEVKTFCKEKKSQQQSELNDVQLSTKASHTKFSHRKNNVTPSPIKVANTPLTVSNTVGTPKRNPYFQLLSKGNRDFGKTEYELTCTGAGGSGDHIINNFNTGVTSGTLHSKKITKQLHHHSDYHSYHQQHQRITPVTKII